MTEDQLALAEIEPLVWAAGARSVAVAVARAVRSFQTFDPLHEVVVVTPAGPTADTVRSLLPAVAEGGGIAGLRFTTVPDLALDLAEPGIRRARPVTSLLLSAAVAHELRVACPPVLAGQARQPATVAAITRAAERLGSLPSGPAATAVLEALGATSVVRKAIVQVAWRARTALRSGGLRDEGLTLASATTALTDGAARVAPLVVVVTDVFPPAHARFVAQLLRARPAHVIVATVPSEGDVDRLDQLRAFVDVSQPPVGAIGGPAQVVSCPDQDEEAREVVRRVLGLVTGPRVAAPQQVAVLYPPHAGYGRRLRDEMNRAGLAWSGPAPETLASSLAGQVLRTLVDCLVDGADRVRVLRLVSLAPRWTTGRAGPRPVHDWQALCRRLGLVRADDWDRAIARLHTERQARMARRGDGSSPPSRHDDRETVVLGQLVSLAGDLTARAARLRSADTWAAVVDLLVAALEAHVGTEAWRDQAWAEAPAWQRRAAVRVERAVRSLGALDELGSSARPDLDGLGALVATLLEAPAPNQGGAGVRLLPLAAGVCLDAQHVFVVGVNEGVLPGSAVDDVLVDRHLPPVASRWVAHRAWQLQRDQRAWRALLGGDASVVATYARTDLRRGGLQYPSAWLAGLPASSVVEHRSHADGVHLGEAATMAELLARAPDLAATLVGRRALRRRAVALRSRLADGPTVFDGCIGPHENHHPARRAQTITAFERYGVCPVHHLMSHVFGARVEDDAIDVVEISALDKGSLVHAVLEVVAAEWLALAEGDRPPWLAGPHLGQVVGRTAHVLDELADQLRAENRLGHAAVWRVEREFALDAIRRSLELDVADGARPLAVEHAFGGGRAQPSMVVPTSVGPVAFDGRIDRVDQLSGGVVRVTDFKTSNAAKRKSVSRSDPTERGTKLQLPLYARVAARDFGDAAQTAVGASVVMRYLYLRRGLAEPAELGGNVDPDFLAAVDRTASAMAQGRFTPAEPDQMYGCESCSPDGLGLEAVAARAAACRPIEEGPVDTDPFDIEVDPIAPDVALHGSDGA